MKRIPTSRTHFTKCLFSEILTSELFECGYKIDASFESRRSDRIGYAVITSERAIRLYVNTNFSHDRIFDGVEMPRELSIIYRAYHIATYIRLLESVRERPHRSYFDSLVTLEAICDEIEGKFTLYSPLSQGVMKSFRPLDAYCAIRALTEIQLRHGDMLTSSSVERCESKVSELISYSSLPEISFESSREPSFALISDMARLSRLVKTNEDVLSKYRFFTSCGAEKLNQMTLPAIYHLGVATSCEFLIQASLRLCAIMNRAALPSDETAAKAVSSFRENTMTFMKDASAYESELLCRNLTAVKKISKKLDELFPDSITTSGAIHYYE